MSDASCTLILGGARSGKSRYGQHLAEASGLALRYLATAEALDTEMASRIERHQAERDARWQTVEAPLALAAAIGANSTPGQFVLVDCLTLWLSNVMHAQRSVDVETRALVTALSEAPGPVALIANEVGLGLVPETPLGRAFRDAQGLLNQTLAAHCDRVLFVAAGLPLTLKG
ncbi:MAG: bifunctional adenosylcobinamide kinase/adenosylcobinamide-phosphate guanylyltransferase [Pseudomonadota bacterium]